MVGNQTVDLAYALAKSKPAPGIARGQAGAVRGSLDFPPVGITHEI